MLDNIKNEKAQDLLFNILVTPGIPTLFSDAINIETDGEVVIFNFAQTLPGTVVIDGKDAKQAPIIARIAISNEHFKRFLSLCSTTSETLNKNKGD